MPVQWHSRNIRCVLANTRPHQLCWGDWEMGKISHSQNGMKWGGSYTVLTSWWCLLHLWTPRWSSHQGTWSVSTRQVGEGGMCTELVSFTTQFRLQWHVYNTLLLEWNLCIGILYTDSNLDICLRGSSSSRLYHQIMLVLSKFAIKGIVVLLFLIQTLNLTPPPP